MAASEADICPNEEVGEHCMVSRAREVRRVDGRTNLGEMASCRHFLVVQGQLVESLSGVRRVCRVNS